MRLKNTLIVVKDVEKSTRFYCDLLGFKKVLENDGNIILSSGLVLQQEDIWRKAIGKDIVQRSNSCELYFEERDLTGFLERAKIAYPEIEFVTDVAKNAWDREVVRFYDLDGNLIEIAQVK